MKITEGSGNVFADIGCQAALLKLARECKTADEFRARAKQLREGVRD